jgi:hypothetical protein
MLNEYLLAQSNGRALVHSVIGPSVSKGITLGKEAAYMNDDFYIGMSLPLNDRYSVSV